MVTKLARFEWGTANSHSAPRLAYCQDEDTKSEVARRIAALWNISAGIPTADLEEADKSGFKLRKK